SRLLQPAPPASVPVWPRLRGLPGLEFPEREPVAPLAAAAPRTCRSPPAGLLLELPRTAAEPRNLDRNPRPQAPPLVPAAARQAVRQQVLDPKAARWILVLPVPARSAHPVPGPILGRWIAHLHRVPVGCRWRVFARSHP